MKQLTIILLLISLTATSQIGEYGELTKNRKTYDTYITKSGDTIKSGDKFTFGIPKNGSAYIFITQGNVPCGAHISGDDFIIKDFIAWSRNKNVSKKMYARCKGYGLIKVDIDFENAIKTGEIEYID